MSHSVITMKSYFGIVVHEVRMTTMSPLVGGPVGAVAAGGGAELHDVHDLAVFVGRGVADTDE